MDHGTVQYTYNTCTYLILYCTVCTVIYWGLFSQNVNHVTYSTVHYYCRNLYDCTVLYANRTVQYRKVLNLYHTMISACSHLPLYHSNHLDSKTSFDHHTQYLSAIVLIERIDFFYRYIPAIYITFQNGKLHIIGKNWPLS